MLEWSWGDSLVMGLVFGGVLVLFVEAPGGVVLGVVGGRVWWFVGTRVINGGYGEVMREYGRYTDRVAQARMSTAGENTASYTLTSASGGAPLVEPAKDYYSTTLIVGDSSVSIHDGVGVDMESRTPYLKDNTREVYFDQVASVSYDRPILRINTSDGDALRYKSSREPDDAMSDLQGRVRSYKTA